MQVKDKKSGEVVGMRYGPAMAAIEAGTHEIVNFDDKGDPKAERPKVKKSAEAK